MYVELYHCSSELKRLARQEKDPSIAARTRAVYLAIEGRDAVQIAAVLGYSRRTVQNWIRSYNRHGLAGLRDQAGRGSKAGLNVDQLQWLRQRIDQGPTADDGICVFHAADIGRIIALQFGINYSIRQVQRLLRKLGYRYLSGRPEHPKGDAEARSAFKKNVIAQIQDIRAKHPGKRIEVWFEDEARFGQQGTLCRLWAMRGSRPRIWRQTQYEYLSVFGAVCPQTGQASGLLAPSINAATVNVFLQQLSAELSPNVHAVLIWDQAGFHTANEIQVPHNVTILSLPPYSPQLNPVERLWQYLRQHYWSNRVYANYDDLRMAVIDALHRVCLNPISIKSICKTSYVESAII